MVRWFQPPAQVRPGSRAARNPGTWISRVISHAAVTGSDQAAARYSRTGGHPRSHAATYPVAVTTVTGQAAMAATARSSHQASRKALRISHRHAVSFSHDHTVTVPPPA